MEDGVTSGIRRNTRRTIFFEFLPYVFFFALCRLESLPTTSLHFYNIPSLPLVFSVPFLC
jgi:hypothetical protein